MKKEIINLLLVSLFVLIFVPSRPVAAMESAWFPEESGTTEELYAFLNKHAYEKLDIPVKMYGLIYDITVQDDLCLVRTLNQAVLYQNGEQVYAFKFYTETGLEWKCYTLENYIYIVHPREDIIVIIDIMSDDMKLYHYDEGEVPIEYRSKCSTSLRQRGRKEIEEGYYGTNQCAETKPFLDYILSQYDRLVWVKDGEHHILYETNVRQNWKGLVILNMIVWILGAGAIVSYVIVYHKFLRKKMNPRKN